MSRIGPVLVLVLGLVGCVTDEPPENPSATLARPTLSPVPSMASIEPTAEPTPSPSVEAVATLVAAGDIAGCDVEGDSATAALVADLEGTLATLGDHVYPDGTEATFADCYDPVWGRFRDRTRPAIGNHDLSGDGGAAYYRYFEGRAGLPGEGWYSYDLGAWHVVVLNSNCQLIACTPGSPQHDWLTDDLAASDARCTLAYMHHPRFSSGPHGDYAAVAPLWDALYAAGVDVILAGHDHLYERFAPQTPSGEADADGIREFTVGTGGYQLYAAERVAPNSEVIIDDTFGVLDLVLEPDAYAWRFLNVDAAPLDEGSDECR